MPKQPQLFDDPTVREPTTETLREPKRLGWKATPAPVGSGPPGETCKTCLFSKHQSAGSKKFYKCEKNRHIWTGGTATDIKLKWAACREWFPVNFWARVRALGDFANQLLEHREEIPGKELLLIIADHYEELGDGQDMGWLRHVANRMEEA